jgi:DnaJ-class molecular chaperone
VLPLLTKAQTSVTAAVSDFAGCLSVSSQYNLREHRCRETADGGNDMRCLYEVLEVDKNADDDVIKKAYRKLALVWHPGN